MKTTNYLIGLMALASFVLVGCSDNDFIGSGPDIVQGTSSQGQLAFRTSGNGKTTRGDITGEQAADKLNKKFTVYGWKYVNASSDAAAEGFEDVFQDYVVKWEGTASAGTTESNVRGWEYVGYQSEPVDASAASYEQTIKYWDWSTDRYDFIAWSIAGGKGQILERNVVPADPKSTTPAAEPGLKFYAPTAKDLGGIYASDKFTSRPENKAKVWAAADWTSFFSGGLANIEDHPDAANHRGKYSQLGTNVTADGEEGIVTLQFRNLAAKARIGIYETIPGYKVSNIVFYRQDGAEGSGTAYQNEWAFEDSNEDYNADQSYATLYADEDIFVKRGNIAIKYHDKYYNNVETSEKDNVAYADVDPTEAEDYFAFGQLTNERGTTTAIASNPIGETSSTASMSIGNDDEKLYTYVFPMEGNENVLKLKVNYLLTSIDGSKENIRVTGANAVVPVEFAKWRANYAYTYLFKISDNTNGYTNPSAGPAGLYPITFDACLVNTEDGLQETITTVNDKSITTYQNGSKITADNEYKKADADATTKTDRIYFTVEGAEGGDALLTLNKTAGASQNVWLYTAWAADPKIITEEAVANYKANNIVLTDVTSMLDLTETEAPNKSGAQYSIKFTAGTVASFEPIAKYYVIKAAYTDAGGTGSKNYITYKVVKIEDGSDAKAYTITPESASIDNNGSTTFTISNAPAGTLTDPEKALVAGNVTGAKGAIVIKNAADKVVNDLFTITEDPDFTYTIVANAPGGEYTVSVGGASTTITVATPAWTTATVYVEEGKTATNVIKDKTGGTVMEGITPVVTPQSGAKGKLTASATNSSGVTTLSPAAGSYGTFKVAYHGAEFIVQVDKYSITADHYIINVGDAEHKTATLTLENANTSGSSVEAKTFTSSNTTAAATVAATSGNTTAEIEASAAGTTTYSYGNATCDIEVVNYELTNNGGATLDGVRTIKLTKDGVAVDGAVFTTTGTAKVQATTTPGVYKVTGTDATTVSFKYKNVVVADISFE